MKKITALFLAVFMVVSVLTACGNSNKSTVSDRNVAADESLSGEITFWHSFIQGARMRHWRMLSIGLEKYILM